MKRKNVATNGAIVLLAAAPAFAQGPIVSVAQGATTEAVSAARWLAILAVLGIGVWLYMSHSHGIGARLVLAILGIYVALNPQTVVGWIQSL